MTPAVNQQGYCDGLLLSFGGIDPHLLLTWRHPREVVLGSCKAEIDHELFSVAWVDDVEFQVSMGCGSESEYPGLRRRHASRIAGVISDNPEQRRLGSASELDELISMSGV
jgi:hypothetical protein